MEEGSDAYSVNLRIINIKVNIFNHITNCTHFCVDFKYFSFIYNFIRAGGARGAGSDNIASFSSVMTRFELTSANASLKC